MTNSNSNAYEMNHISFSNLNSLRSDVSFVDRRQGHLVFSSVIGYESLITMSLQNLKISNSSITISRLGTTGISKNGYTTEIRRDKDSDYVHAMFCVKDTVIQSEDGDDTIDFTIIYNTINTSKDDINQLLIKQTYNKLNKSSVIPMIEEWSEYIYNRLRNSGRLYELRKITNNTNNTLEMIRVRTPNSFVKTIIEEGLKSKAINVKNVNSSSLVMQSITGLDSYLATFGETLAEKIQTSFRPKFIPKQDKYSISTNDVDDYLYYNSNKQKELYEGQKAVIQSTVNNLNKNHNSYIISEQGSGKSIMGATTTYAHHKQKKNFKEAKRGLNAILMCPSHLTNKWVREIEESVPNSKGYVIKTLDELLELEPRLRNKNKAENSYIVISKETAKLTYTTRPSALWSNSKKAFICPCCNKVLTKEVTQDIAGKKQKIKVKLEKLDFQKEYQYNLVCDNEVKKLDKATNTWSKKKCNSKLWTACNKDELNTKWIKLGKNGWVYKQHIPELTNHYATRSLKLSKVESQLFTELYEQNKLLETGNDIGVKYNGTKKVSISTYIRKRMNKVFDYCILDEIHLLLNQSLQSQSSDDLIKSCDKTILLTATLLNGYAESLFYLLYRTNPRMMLKAGYAYTDIARFSKDYGVNAKEFTTEARTRRRKQSKNKKLPGVSPLVFTNFLMDNAVFLSLSDMSEGLPEYNEIPLAVRLDSDIYEHYTDFESNFRHNAAPKRGTSRKHVSQMMQSLITYPDSPHCSKPIYSENESNELELVYTPFKTQYRVSEKEYRLLELVKQKIANKEKVLVYYSNVGTTDIGDNLNKLFKDNNITSYELKASVSPDKREQWVNDHIEKKDMEVMICNPSLVETGLDLLDFTTIVFYQLGYNLFTMRQASRRSWRLSQTRPKIEVYFMYYAGTIQEQIVALMANKLQAAMAIEGKFSEEGLKAMSNNEDMLTQIANNVVNGIKETVNQDIFKATDFKSSKDAVKKEHYKTLQELNIKMNGYGEKSLFNQAIQTKYKAMSKNNKTNNISNIDNVLSLFC